MARTPKKPDPALAADDDPTPAAEDDEVDVVAEAEPEVEADAPDEEEDEEETADDDVVVVADDEDLVEEEEVKPVVVARPAGRPSPGRPPGAKEEPDPPYYVGERIRLTSNVRPRTGALIGDYPVGAEGHVETVLSQTCIVRFEMAADTKEVVAFTCLESIDPEAQARRAERDRLKKAAEKAAEKAAT